MDIDMMQPVQQVLMPSLNATSYPETLHILAGSFRSVSLFLLAFSPAQRSLSLVHRAPGYGPHQYLATNRDKLRSSRRGDIEESDGLVAFTTSWAVPPILSSWEITRDWQINHLDNVPITAVSSYITLPPPYTHLYSMGGPTGEVHLLSPQTGSFEEKIQEVPFVPSDKLADADKSRKALRYGSHAIEFTHVPGTNTRLAFVPVLGTNSIEVYLHDPQSGHLTHVFSSPSPRDGVQDGPRHLKIHPNGEMLYCVTEHTNLLDTYSIGVDGEADSNGEWSKNPLTYLDTRSLLPPDLSYPNAPMDVVHRFRGDTLMLGPGAAGGQLPTEIWATTRGATEEDRGWVSVFRLDEDGMFIRSASENESLTAPVLERYETPTSGGKAHAIDLYPKQPSSLPSSFSQSNLTVKGTPVWILLTDDSDYAAGKSQEGESARVIRPRGGVRVLEWNGWSSSGVREVVGWPSENGAETESTILEELMHGASHAIWLTADEVD
ncbi:hypothetical protein FB446DRAFT_691636 [Lentinula raphanica]|nr:hypothetical protein FB446DRAFT_691636 [Lentinula raphanica]